MAKSIIVSNTTPLIALAWLEQLALLPRLFDTIHIPRAVQDELLHNPDAVGVAEFRAAPWLKVTPVTNHLAVVLLLDQLDVGESEAIVLTHELQAGLLLMDERRGRRRAMQGGLTIVGTLGILVEARQRDFVGPLTPLLEKLQRLPFYMSQTLMTRVLQQVGE
jgi:predicted nucleic acid-binding protein